MPRAGIRLEGDLRSTPVAGQRAEKPVDIPGNVSADPKEPDPRRRLRSRHLAGAQEESCQRVGRDAVGEVREKGGHPAALLAKPEPTLIVTLAQGFPTQCAAAHALARWQRLFLVH